MPGIALESPENNLKTLFSWVFLANWFSTNFCIFIYSFSDIDLFIINCNLLQFLDRLWTVSTHFYSFANRFCSFLLVYQSFLLVSTRLPFASHFCLLTSRFYSFLLIYQTFLVVYQSFHILVLKQEPNSTSYINKTYYWKIFI